MEEEKGGRRSPCLEGRKEGRREAKTGRGGSVFLLCSVPVPRGSIWGKCCRWPAQHWQGAGGHGRDEQPHGTAPAVSVQSPVSRASSASRRETGDILLIKDIQSARGIFGNLNVDTTVVKLAFRAWLPHAQRGVSVPDPVRPLGPALRSLAVPRPPRHLRRLSPPVLLAAGVPQGLPSPPLLIAPHSLARVSFPSHGPAYHLLTHDV